MKRFLLLPLFIWLVACAPEKYPYPPQFVAVDAQTLTLLPPPPATDSETYAASLAAVLQAQQDLTPAVQQAIVAEDHIAPTMIVAPVLGKDVTPEHFPALYALLGHVQSDAWRINDVLQDHWKVDRPWVADARVKLYAPQISRPSYPSGHTVTNHVWAWVLSDVVPCQKDAFFARANEIAFHRVTGGVHFPTDVEAGKKLAAQLYEKMQQSPDFIAQRNAARAELAAWMGKAKPAGKKPKRHAGK